MLKPMTKTIGGYAVTFVPLPATSAAALDVRVVRLLLPVLNSVDLSKVTDLKADVDLSGVLPAIQGALATLDTASINALLIDSLTGCTIVAPGQPAEEVTSLDVIDRLFAGELDTMYRVVFESWRFNRLSPFKLAATFGLHPQGTATSAPQSETPSAHGLKLAK